MGKPNVQLLELIYDDGAELKTEHVLVTLGDTIRAQDWAKEQGFGDQRTEDSRAGLFAIFLAAKRKGLPNTEGDYLEFLDVVTVPDGDLEVPAGSLSQEHPGIELVEPGESAGPPSEH